MKTVNVGFPLIQLQSVDSTNSYASQLLRMSEVTEGTAILAVQQTHGKGYGGSQWISEPGQNLLFSFILKPGFLPADHQFYLSMCVSNAILDFISGLAGPVCVKWPNDILLQGGKVAGILIENTVLDRNLYTSVIGIGLNVNQKNFPPGLPNPVSLSIAAGTEFDLSDTLTSLFGSLNTHISILYQEEYARIKTAYLNNLQGLNEWAIFEDQSGTFEGRIVDVADTGELIVANHEGEVKQYRFKEVTVKT